MSSAITLTSLFDKIGVNFRLFDLGTGRRKLDLATWQGVEERGASYPTPYLRHAWLAIVFWPEQQYQASSVWFIRLPLDEQAKLVQSERDRFVRMVMVALGNNLEAQQQNKQIQAVLENNPFVFTPTPEKQASINSHLKRVFKLPMSEHHQPAMNYLQAPESGLWQDLAVQGLADVCARWSETTEHKALGNGISQLGSEPLKHLSQCLENEMLDEPLSKLFLQRLMDTLAGEDDNRTDILNSCLRALSQSQSASYRQAACQALLAQPEALDVELLAALATRFGDCISQPELCLTYLECLAKAGDQAFVGMVGELLYHSQLRSNIWQALRSPERSERLAQALGVLMSPPTEH